MPRLDLDTVRHALTTAQKLGYREVELTMGEDHFHAKLGGARVRSAPAPSHAQPEGNAVDEAVSLKAPSVGFYREADPPLAVGQEIEQGDVVAMIVALGIANDVESKWTGKVSEVLVEPDQPVEYGQVLAKIQIRP